LCNNEYPLTDEHFYVRRDVVKGKEYFNFRKECISCSVLKRQIHRNENPDVRRKSSAIWREKNREKIRSEQLEWQRNNKDRCKIYRDNWRSENQDKIKKSSQVYYIENKEKISISNKNWRENNPTHANLTTHKYFSRKRNLNFDFVDNDWNYALKYFDNMCVVCGVSDCKLNKDHWIPLSRNDIYNPGTVPKNIVPLCQHCNQSKQNKLPFDWLSLKFGVDFANEVINKVEAFFSTVRKVE
jgi:hypothetical protein